MRPAPDEATSAHGESSGTGAARVEQALSDTEREIPLLVLDPHRSRQDPRIHQPRELDKDLGASEWRGPGRLMILLSTPVFEAIGRLD